MLLPLVLRALALVVLAAFAAGSVSCGSSDSPEDLAAEGRPPYPEVTPNGQIRGEGNFATLIRTRSQGQPRRAPWAGYWWPYSQEGISDAAARHDAAHGRDSAAWERINHGSGLPNLQSWFGHCNGWAAAAVLYDEPREAVSVDGQRFGVADQKALLSEIAMEVRADFFGSRSDTDNSSSLTFADVAPDVFFLALTNYVGNGMPMILDRYTGSQVWNQPIAGYRIDPIRPEDYLGESPAGPGVHRVRVTTRIWWLRDDVPGGHLTEPFAFADGASYESRALRYEVWLDSPPVFDASGALTGSGQLIVARQGATAVGGAWRNGSLETANSHPDYLWIPHSITPSTGFANPRVDAGWVQARFGRRGS